MRIEGLSLHFIKTVLLLAKIQSLTKDSFFLDKFNSKMYSFSLSFLELVKEGNVNVAQRQVSSERHTASIDSLRDVIKEFQYLGIVKDNPLLLQVELNLLNIKLELSRIKNGLPVDHNGDSDSNRYEQKVTPKNAEITRTVTKKTDRLASSKKKILDFIKSYPNTRTKDIVYEFNALSDRTVKRNLTDLLRAGLVKKRIDNKAVYYYASE